MEYFSRKQKSDICNKNICQHCVRDIQFLNCILDNDLDQILDSDLDCIRNPACVQCDILDHIIVYSLMQMTS